MESEQKKQVALIIPCYNEEKRLAKSLSDLFLYFQNNHDAIWSLVFVNDGSTDRTPEMIEKFILEKKAESNLVIQLINLPENSGKGSAIKAGLADVEVDIYGYLDVDLSIDYRTSLKDVLAEFDRGQDVVIGWRQKNNQEGYSWSRKIGSFLIGKMAKILFGLPIHDIQCGFKFFNSKGREIALGVKQNRFSFDMEFLAWVKQAHLKISELPVAWQHVGDSSVRWSDGLRFVGDFLLITEDCYSNKTWTKIYLAIGVIISFAVFGWTIFYGYFFSDDFTWLWHGYKILAGQISWWQAHVSTFYSPVLNVFYALSYAWFGFFAPWYFAVGILVHGLNSFLVGRLAKEFIGSATAGLVATVLFAFGGGAYEPMVWIGANMHSIAVLFILLSVWYFWQAKQNKRQALSFGLSIIFLLLALGTKEIAVALPFITISIGIIYFYRNFASTWLTKVYWLVLAGLLTAYGIKQYLAQVNSVWVESGAFSFSLAKIFRFPLVLADIFVPLNHLLNADNAKILCFITSIGLGLILWKYRKIKAVWLGFIWSSLAIGTVLFFNVISWWELLPSRYTYSARVGVVIIISAILVYHLKNSAHYRVFANMVWVIVFVVAWQIINMAGIIKKEYLYVYNSGRSLFSAVEEINQIQPKKVWVEWERPFEKNFAHVVGLLECKASLPENRIIFLSPQEHVIPTDGEVVLNWDMEKEKYYVKHD